MMPADGRGGRAMLAPFLGFGPKALDWFRGLEADNSKAYFEANRAVWEEQVRGPLERLLEELGADLGGSAKLFRPHRDVRFSKNKAPYKTNNYGVVMVPGSQSGLYVSISSGGLHAGSGYGQMAPDQLARYREAVTGPDGPALDAAMRRMEATGIKVWGEALKTAPRGAPKDHALAHLLRMKDVLAGDELGPEATLDGRRPKDFARSVWDRSREVMAWMDAHVGPSRIPPEARAARR
jgi:uncharacterized protein (TIGR02453 family)